MAYFIDRELFGGFGTMAKMYRGGPWPEGTPQQGYQSPLTPQEVYRFGVAEVNGDRIVSIEEKPSRPKSNYAVTGIYMYDATVFDKIKTLVPSGRGELEITDVNNAYIREGNMTFSFLEGWWTDAGTFDSLLRAANLVAGSPARKESAPELEGAAKA